jgi:hypothetical protein
MFVLVDQLQPCKQFRHHKFLFVRMTGKGTINLYNKKISDKVMKDETFSSREVVFNATYNIHR